MAVTTLESLVLRGVSVVRNGGSEKRIGSKLAGERTSAYRPIHTPTSRFPAANQPMPWLNPDIGDDAMQQAGRPGSAGVLASRSLASARASAAVAWPLAKAPRDRFTTTQGSVLARCPRTGPAFGGREASTASTQGEGQG